jgi:Flp pilus assembly protein TadG
MLARCQTKLRLFYRDTRGVAAIEMALAGLTLVLAVLNCVDCGVYAYRKMEVANAAQVGAQAAWKTCYDASSMLPATQNCAGLNSAITTAIQSTSLGTAVKLASGYPKEGYYCVNTSGALQAVGSLSSKPANCAAAGNPNLAPGDYVQVAVTCSYAPLFPNLTVMAALGVSSITMTSWMRLG